MLIRNSLFRAVPSGDLKKPSPEIYIVLVIETGWKKVCGWSAIKNIVLSIN
jgi:hypothetical protein